MILIMIVLVMVVLVYQKDVSLYVYVLMDSLEQTVKLRLIPVTLILVRMMVPV